MAERTHCVFDPRRVVPGQRLKVMKEERVKKERNGQGYEARHLKKWKERRLREKKGGRE